MQLQNRIEQTAKEYLTYKSLYENKKKEIEEVKKDLASISKSLDEEATYGEVFDKIGSVELLGTDMYQMKTQLYHQLRLAEDVVEIPQDIKDLVSDYKQTFIYTTTGEIADKESYNQYKKNYIEQAKEFKKIMSKNNE